MPEPEFRAVSPGCGVEVHGVDLRRLSNSDFAALRAAFHRHGVLFLRGQALTPDDHVGFARRWGEIVINEHFPEMDGRREIAVVAKEPEQKTNIGGGWHADHSYDPEPALGSILLAREVPDSGGDTLFANMVAAWAGLSTGLKSTLLTLRAHHSSRHLYGPGGIYEKTDLKARLKPGGNLSDAVHPVAIRHPVTGETALYVNPGHTMGFEGWGRPESRALLDWLFQHATQPRYTCRWRWQAGDVALWDNRSTWHYAVNDYDGQRRVMHRITIAGEPLAAAAA